MIETSALPKADLDYHKAITIKERSSRYIRTALDYFRIQKGEEAFHRFLEEVELSRQSSVFQHIYDDANWNSYALEVFLYQKIMSKFDDPYRAVWEFGVASGSGRLDQKDTLFSMKVKMAPLKVLIRKIAETTEMVTLISETSATWRKPFYMGSQKMNSVELVWDYKKLPVGFYKPHWSSIVAGFGIVYGILLYRKALTEVDYHIHLWPILPSDLPHYQGREYIHDPERQLLLDKATGAKIAATDQGPFVLGKDTFNHRSKAACVFTWQSESVGKKFARITYLRPSVIREENRRVYREQIIADMNAEHQQKMALYEQELSERARIIQEKMREIEELKIQQDGDYFLTSLLLRPLIVKNNRSRFVDIDFFVCSKKTFYFRRKRSELGGDLCITDNVVLRDRRYSVFLNGDAMGKSMQGASGALVLGVVFNAYLSRSHYSSHQKSKNPEQWLKDCYLDLQNVFISFDGSMFISAVVGLVDEETGTVYFFNAEHPFMVLYRNGESSFIEREMDMRKLGTPGQENRIRIQVFQMQPEDVIIAGSDGRDDLELAVHNGVRVINEDEFAFLDRVKEAKGGLRRIAARLRRHGDFTDDLSLLRIHFSPPDSSRRWIHNHDEDGSLQRLAELVFTDFAQALQLWRNLTRKWRIAPQLERRLGWAFWSHGYYQEAVKVWYPYLQKAPFDSEIFYYFSVASFYNGDVNRAIDYAERLALRQPTHLANLVHLTQLYDLAGNQDRSLHFGKRALAVDSNNLYAKNFMLPR